MTIDKTRDKLEAMIDATSLEHVLSMVSEVAEQKADHIRTNWQDDNTANVWADKARDIDRLPSYGI